MIKGVLFDMDGVLLDSEYLTIEAAIRHFGKKGVMINHEDFVPFYGTGEAGFFGGVARKHGIPYNNSIEAEEIYKEYASLAKGKIIPLPGVPEFISTCRRKNLKLAVATSANKLKMKLNLQMLGFDNGIFDALVCGNDITFNKPDPEIFLLAARKLGLDTKDCLVVEDAPSGVEAAKRAGAKCLAVLTTFSKHDLYKADWIVQNLTEYPAELFTVV